LLRKLFVVIIKQKQNVMKKTLINKLIVILFAVAITLPFVAFAALLPDTPYDKGQASTAFGSGNTVTQILTKILSILLQFAGLVSVIFIVYGGYRYVTAGGNEDAAESAKHIITNAVIGFAVIVLSFVILKVVENALSTSAI